MRITRLVAYVIHNGRCSTPNLSFPLIRVVVAEWLRRWTRSPLGSPRAGSNPADYEYLFFLSSHFFKTVHLFLFSGIKFNSYTGNCYSLRSTGRVVRIPDKLTFNCSPPCAMSQFFIYLRFIVILIGKLQRGGCELRKIQIYMKICDRRSCNSNLSNCKLTLKKIGVSREFEPMASALVLQCFTS